MDTVLRRGSTDEVWRTRDYLGRMTVLDRSRREHVLVRHRQLTGRLHEVRQAVENPSLVTRDLRFRHWENYYAPSTVETGQIKVVVHYRPVAPQGTWLGDVITAYPVREPNPREERLYP